MSIGFAHSQSKLTAFSEVSRRDFVNISQDYSVIYRREQTIVVRDRRGMDHAAYTFLSNARCQPLNFEATVTDMISGKVVKRIKLRDLPERSYISDISLYEDDRIKFFEPENLPVPFRVDLVAEFTCSDNFSIRSWFPQGHGQQLVKDAELHAIFPAQVGLRYRTRNFIQSPDSSSMNGIVHLRWKLDSIPSRETASIDSVPWVQLAPKNFALGGISSDMSTWEGFGRFYGRLSEGKDELPDFFKPEVHRMVEGAGDEFEKISRLYLYLQKNFRYLIIFLGIDGWEPRKAEEVLAAKYGECKGLSTLMKAMLKEIGIEAQYVLVNAGDGEVRDLDEDFPVNSFNHAFLRIPLEGEVLWLECTNDFLPAGFSGDFTSDRDVFVITKDGGFLDRTPSFSDPRFHRIANSYTLELLQNGDAELSGINYYSGFHAINLWGLDRHADSKYMQTYLNQSLAGNGTLVKDYHLTKSAQRELPEATLAYRAIVQRFAQQTAKRVILPSHWRKIEPALLDAGVLDWEEQMEIRLPENLTLESGIENYSYQDPDFEYGVSMDLQDNTLKISSRLRVHCAQKPGAQERSMLYNKINQQFNKSIIFRKPAPL